MKELIKVNNKEEQYSNMNIEGYCERGDGYYDSYCSRESGWFYSCSGNYSSDDSGEDVLF